MRIASVLTRLTSLGATAVLVATGLVATTFVAPSAVADIPVIQQPTVNTVTADALPTVQIDGVVWKQQIVGNTVYVGGQFANARPAGAAPGTNLTARANLLAYNLTTGALIPGFNPTLNAQVYAIAVSPDGTKLYVGGSFTKVGTVAKNRIAAFNVATGALITTFAAGVDYTVKSIVATNDAVYVGGAFSSANGSPRSRLAAFNPTTGALMAWAPSADATVNALTLTPDNNYVIAGGAFQNVNAASAYGLAKLDGVSGALQPWNTTNLIRDAGATSAILSLSTANGAIYGTGYTFGPGNLEGAFSADPVTGNINWVEDCHGDTYDHWAGNGVVYTVSHDHYCGNLGGFPQSDPWSINMRHALAFTAQATGTLGHDPHGYYDFYGTPAPSMLNWFPEMDSGTYTGKNQAAWSITGNSQYVILGGEFPTVNGVAQQGLVRFAVSSIAPNEIAPTTSGAAFNPSVIGLPSGAARVAWQANSDRDDHTLTYRLTRNNVVVYTVTADSTFWNRPTMGFVDTGLVAGTVYKYRLSATDPAGNVAQSEIVNFTAPAAGSTNAYAQQVVADGAAPYWPMNETAGTVLFDNAGFNDADTGAGVTRGTTPGTVATDAATTFDGATSASTRTAIAGPDTFTSQAWIKTTTTSGGKIIGFGSNQTGLSSSYDRMVYMDNAGHIYFGVYPNGVAEIHSASSYNDGQWHQISATLGADGMKLYIDAKLVAQRTDVTWGQVYSGYWRVGGDNLGGWPNQPSSNYFAGVIDEVAIYPTVLSRATINGQWVASGRTSTIPAAPADPYGAAVFNDNPLLYWRLGETSGVVAADSSQNADQSGVIENGVVLGATGGIKGTTNTAASFDGNDDLVASTNSYTNPLNYSEEAWFKTTSTNGGKIIGFGASQNGTSGNYDRHVYMSNDGTVTFGVWTGFTNTITTPTALNDGKWHHVVATQSTTVGMALYIDGALAGTNGQTGSQAYTGYWRVGGDNHWGCCSPFIAATIDDVAVYDSVLSAASIANHFNLGNTVVAANTPPVAALTSSATYLDASFDGSSSTDPNGSVTGYAWDFGDNTTASGVTASHSYAAAGQYTVTLTVTDNAGETNVKTALITVTNPPANVLPTATFLVNTSVLTSSVDASGSVDADGTIAGYAWDFGDGFTTTGATASHTYAASGSYTITLVVTDNKGGTATTTQSVNPTAPVNQAPVASFTATADQLKLTVNGTASSDPDGSILSYAWDFGDGGTATGATPAVHTYATAGSKSVTLTVTDNKGAVNSSTQPVEVTAPPVNVGPTASFTFTKSNLTLNVESASTDPDGTITGYAWNFGDNATAVDAAAVHTYASAGTYPVTLTVTDNNGVIGTVTQSVTVAAAAPANAAPVAGFTFTAANLVASFDGATSVDSDGSIAAYSWNFGDNGTDLVSTAGASHTFAAAGTYTVALTVTDNSGATNTVTRAVTVTAPVATPLVNDSFGRTSASGWGSAEVGGAWTVAGGAANFSVNGGTGKVRLTAAGAGPSATLGAPSSANTNLALDVSLDKAATGGGVYVSVAARKVGTSEYRTTAKFLANGSVQLQLVKIVTGTSTTLRTITVPGLTYTAGDTVTVKFQVSGTTTVNLSAKVWKTGTTEPAGWQTTATDTTGTLSTTGGIALYPYLSGTSTNAPVVVSFDNLKVYGVQP